MTPELFPLTHEPETAVRPSVYGEGIYVEQWKKLLAEVPEYGDGEVDEMFQTILGDLLPVDQRDATAAASFVCWLGTNAGNCFTLYAKRLQDGGIEQPFLTAWARQNVRRSYINGGKRTVEAILREPTIRDLEVIEKVAEWLGSPAGAKFVKAAEFEIEETRKAIQEQNQAKLRAANRARDVARAEGEPTLDFDISKLSDRQIANVLHGRAPDDNGEFTASSMGAAQDALRGKR